MHVAQKCLRFDWIRFWIDSASVKSVWTRGFEIGGQTGVPVVTYRNGAEMALGHPSGLAGGGPLNPGHGSFNGGVVGQVQPSPQRC